MKQVFLSGQGQIEVFDVPVPGKIRDSILVRNAFSLISTGTEGAAVSSRSGLPGLYEKVTSSKDKVHLVWDMVKKQGVPRTLELVRSKLADHGALGYSCAGRVVELENENLSYKDGQRVACMGVGYASHAEFVVIPKNLAVPIPDGVSYENAAFGAIACIAMQGIRRLKASPGETIGVIGLGLIGQVAARLLVAMGYGVVGLDLSPERAEVANSRVGINAWAGSTDENLARVGTLTKGNGLDGVLVCASGKSDGPVNLAFDLCRKRGSVSIIGDVGLNLTRAKMYAKELDLRMSCSYGPGRYDPDYELDGRDYPIGFVRWTERRNLELFLALLADQRLDISDLNSDTFRVTDANKAYSHIKEARSETFGVLLDYGLPSDQPVVCDDDYVRRHHDPGTIKSGVIQIGLVGAGSYTKAVHVPNLQKLSDSFQIHTIASRTGSTATILAKKTGAHVSTSDFRQVLKDENVDAILISTRHATHGDIALEGLEAGKHLFIEKPMCLDVDQGKEIQRMAAEKGLVVRVGFNRRFAPMLVAAKKAIGSGGRRLLSYHVNLGAIGEHWSNTREEGGRFLGEGVHFLDLCNWFAGEFPTSVSAAFLGEPDELNPNLSTTLHYANGTVCHVIYTTQGAAAMGKEFFVMHGNGVSARCDDFIKLNIKGNRGPLSRIGKGLKGQREELVEFSEAIHGRSADFAADARAGWIATWMVHAGLESAREGKHVFFPNA